MRCVVWLAITLLLSACAVGAPEQTPKITPVLPLESFTGRTEEQLKPELREAEAIGAEGPSLARTLNDLAKVYYGQGRYGEVEPLLRRAMAIQEKALGPEHLDLATPLRNLALLYQAQGSYGEAEPLLMRALTIQEKALGPQHRDLFKVLTYLAENHRAQGHCREAEAFYRRALTLLGVERFVFICP